jgi:hypothetical protein
MWAIVQELGGEHPEKLATIPPETHADWMAQCYVQGTQAYEESDQAKAEIIALNKRVYACTLQTTTTRLLAKSIGPAGSGAMIISMLFTRKSAVDSRSTIPKVRPPGLASKPCRSN